MIYRKISYLDGNWIVEDIPLSEVEKTETYCSHEFKEYIGFTEKYHYCIRCDKKQEKANEETRPIFY